MFARNFLRCARTTTRAYSTQAPAPKSNTTLILGTVVAAGAGAYYYMNNVQGGIAPKVSTKPAIPTLTEEAGWVSLKVLESKDVSPTSKIIKFALPSEDHVLGLKVASAILTRFKPEGKDKFVLRPYTPISEEDERGHMDLLIKKYPNGPMSSHIHELKPGDTLDVKGPLPKYEWSPNKHEHIACIAGGTGITPMYQLIRAILKNPEDKTRVTLIFGNVNENEVLLKEELRQLENTYPQKFSAVYLLDNAPEGAGWATKGYVTKDLLKQVLPEPKSGNNKIFVCGPPAMYNAVSGNKVSPKDQGPLSGMLKELGYTEEDVYKF